MDIGSAVGRRLGLTEAKLRALDDFERSDEFTEPERLALRYAAAMTRTPVEVDDDLFRALQERLSSKELVELTSCIAWENYRARFDHAFGVEAEGFSDGAYCPMVQPHR